MMDAVQCADHIHHALEEFNQSFPEHRHMKFRSRSQGGEARCASNHLIVGIYRVPQMQGVGRADVLLYFKCLAGAVPCERLRNFVSVFTWEM
jgi:hypothetical protein